MSTTGSIITGADLTELIRRIEALECYVSALRAADKERYDFFVRQNERMKAIEEKLK